MGLHTLFDQLTNIVDGQAWLDTFAVPLQDGIEAMYRAGGSLGSHVRDLLSGAWLAHPLHPVLTDVPTGAWTAAVTLDAIEMLTGNSSLAPGADLAIGMGITGGLAAATAGLSDWHYTTGRSRRVGMMHALLNVGALGLFTASLVARRRCKRPLGWGLALAGYSVMIASAYLGGDLVFQEKVGVDHAPQLEPARTYKAAVSADDLPEGKPYRVLFGETPVVLVKQGKTIYALADTCAHLGGPLSGGQFDEEEGTITCPWHSSTYCLSDGKLVGGPSAYDQPRFDVRVKNGVVELRPVASK